MKKSTQWWLAVGVVLAGLFFAGAVAVMWLTDDTVNQDDGIPRDPADSIIQNQPPDVDRVSIRWPAAPWTTQNSPGREILGQFVR